MLNYLKRNTLVQKYKDTPIGQRLKRTSIVRFLLESQGDWRYPFLVVLWWISRTLVPRRRVSVDNVSFTLSCTNWITHFRWYLFPKKDVEVRNYINEYVKDNDVFFDIGANVGVFSVYAAKRHPTVSVYCFEPEYANLNTLKDNIVCNDLLGEVKIYSVAIGDFVGFSELHLQDLTTGSAAHSENKKQLDMTDEGYPVVWSEGIISVTVDHICEQLNIIPNTMKIDTDGGEAKIFKGAVRTLSNANFRSLIVEIPEDTKKRDDCHKILESAGLSLAWSDRKKTKNEIWVRGRTKNE